MTNYVYLLHFSEPIAPGRHTCQHYLGSADNVDERFKLHLTGKGARLCQVALERGIDFEVVKVWEAESGKARQLERQLKRRKEGPNLCPICFSERKRHKWQLSLWKDIDLEFTLDDLPERSF